MTIIPTRGTVDMMICYLCSFSTLFQWYEHNTFHSESSFQPTRILLPRGCLAVAGHVLLVTTR